MRATGQVKKTGMINKALLSLITGVTLAGCQASVPQPQVVSCNPMLISCAEQIDQYSGLFVAPVDVHPEDLQYRIAEIRRWLKWQREVQLGLTDQAFETHLDTLEGLKVEELHLELTLSPEDRKLLVQSWN